ncbi:hypothetical protein N9R87_04810 [Flavobacteriaceae bacterium]|nr:hypothetical protein [Flavobacteriaceae bacterium]
MKRYFYFSVFFCFLMLWSSCRKDFDFTPTEGSLRFSKDTVYLDTVFSNIGSSTYTLKVYNTTDNNISIPKIKLQKGQNSNYRLNVDGMTGDTPLTGKEFTNVELLAKDSMYIFIETTIDIQSLATNNTQFLYTDAIEFGQLNLQKVELVTLVKDAVFIYPQQLTNPDGSTVIETLNFDIDGDGIEDETNIQGRFLEDNELIFTNEKPYVIYGYAAVDSGKTLTIEAGARVHFHANSGLLVTSNASIHANGLLSSDTELMENEIIFEGDRLEPSFAEVPGQWQTIWLFEGSTNNTFNHTTIKNGTVGLFVDGNQDDASKLEVSNTQIYNSSNFGILGRATNITAENLVINKSGQSSFAATFGGHYDIVHATIANYWTNSFRQFPSLLVNNFTVDLEQNIIPNDLSSATFTNCIIYGNDNPEVLLDPVSEADFNFKFNNCLIYFNDPNNNFTSPYYNFDDSNLYENMRFNFDPEFLNTQQNKLQIPLNSPAASQGTSAGNLTTDITGALRSSPSDLGAYNATDFEN